MNGPWPFGRVEVSRNTCTVSTCCNEEKHSPWGSSKLREGAKVPIPAFSFQGNRAVDWRCEASVRINTSVLILYY